MKRGAEFCTDSYAMNCKKMKFSNGEGKNPRVLDYSDSFTFPELLESIKLGKYGSITKDVAALISRKMEVFNELFTLYPDLEHDNGEVVGLENKDILEIVDAKPIVATTDPVIIIDSDEEEDGGQKLLSHFQEIAIPRPSIALITDNTLVHSHMSVKTPKKEEMKVDKVKDKGTYVGVDDEMNEDDLGSIVEDEELSDIWKEMNFALESSKFKILDPPLLGPWA